MCQKMCLGVHVQELDDILVTNDAAATCLWESLGWDDLPLIVRVIVSITGDLLTYKTMSKTIGMCGEIVHTLTAYATVVVLERVKFRV